ncbi:hypothetical protein [Rhodobacter sp. NSM]|uniref:hypothetical protein n=1 Tax=Rhodobacter sp. NSM TaxID=3457501 RepID=UPI003FD373EC
MSRTLLPRLTEGRRSGATLRQDGRAHEILTFGPMTHGSVGHGSLGAWGMLTLILTEGCLFGYLLFSYAEGRTRFLAVWGLFSSLIFLVATLANSIALVWGIPAPPEPRILSSGQVIRPASVAGAVRTGKGGPHE